jgi:hypothetical protein
LIPDRFNAARRRELAYMLRLMEVWVVVLVAEAV